HPVGDRLVDAERSLTAAIYQKDVTTARGKPPPFARGSAIRKWLGRLRDGSAGVDEAVPILHVEIKDVRRFGKREIDLARPASEHPCRDARMAVTRLLHDRDAVNDGVGEHQRRRIPS